jgi:hypothetical protein
MNQSDTGIVKNGTATVAASNRYMSNKNGTAAPATTTSTTTIEDLYKYFGILADAKDKAGEVLFRQ